MQSSRSWAFWGAEGIDLALHFAKTMSPSVAMLHATCRDVKVGLEAKCGIGAPESGVKRGASDSAMQTLK